MVIQGRIWQLWVCASLFVVAWIIPRPVPAEDSNVVERFEMEKNGEAILIPVQMNGKESLFLVDTGSTWTVFDKSLLSFEPKGQMTFEGAEWNYYNVPLASLGQRNLGDDLIAGQRIARIWTLPFERVSEVTRPAPFIFGLDLTKLRQVSGLEICGIIGMDFLRNWVVQIDFDRGQLSLLKELKVTERGDPFDLDFNDMGQPLLHHCQISDWGESDFLLDTGCSGNGDLERQVARCLCQRGHAEPVGTGRKFMFGGDRECRYFQLKSMAVGSHRIDKLHLSDGHDNILGLGYLSRYQVTFDFPHLMLYLREGKRFNLPDDGEINHSGIHLLRVNKKTIVDLIDADSTAEQSGIKVGDILVKVNDLDADTLSMYDVRRTFCRKNSIVRVIAEREGKQFEATIELK